MYSLKKKKKESKRSNSPPANPGIVNPLKDQFVYVMN